MISLCAGYAGDGLITKRRRPKRILWSLIQTSIMRIEKKFKQVSWVVRYAELPPYQPFGRARHDG